MIEFINKIGQNYGKYFLYVNNLCVGGVYIVINNKHCEMILWSLSIFEEHRGKKYGSLLMSEVEKKALKLGLARITLGVNGYNTVALNLYKKHGYIFKDVVEVTEFNKDYWMIKKLH